jgi:hypothetical protein
LETEEQAIKYLRDAPPAISGGGGHNLTFRLSIDLVQGFMLNQDVALKLLLEWNLRCDPPWSQSELKHKVEDAMKVERKKPAGWLISKKGGRKYIIPDPIVFHNDMLLDERSYQLPKFCPDGFSIKAHQAGELIPRGGHSYQKWLEQNQGFHAK